MNVSLNRSVTARCLPEGVRSGEFVRKTVAEAGRSPDNMNAHLDVLSIAKNLERIADLASNIAEDVIYLVSGQIVRHRRS